MNLKIINFVIITIIIYPCNALTQNWNSLGTGMTGGVSIVYEFTEFNGNLIIGGDFTMAGGTNADNIAKWNDTNFSALNVGINDKVSGLAVYNGELYAGGWFSSAGGNIIKRVAKWDGNNWTDPEFPSTGLVFILRVFDGILYVGGNFGLYKYDGNNWTYTGLSGLVYDIELYQGELYVGGSLSSYNHIVKLDNTSNNWMTVGGGTDNPVNALEVYDGKLYVGGSFNIAGGTANHIAIWDGASWSTIGSGMDDRIQALLSYGNKLYAGGNFTIANMVSASHIAVWDGTTWSPLGVGMNDNVGCLQIYNGYLYAGGSFSTAGGNSAYKIARWGCLSLYSEFDYTISNYSVSYSNLSQNADNWAWDFGDGNTSTSQNPIHIYDTVGSYLVCLISYNSCDSAVFCDSVIINCIPPVASYQYVDSELTVIFTDNSIGAQNWLWDFGDGYTDTSQNPTHIYDSVGIYNVCLTVTNNCGVETFCNNITTSLLGIVNNNPKNRTLVFPNPFTSSTIIIIPVKSDETYSLILYNATGQQVKKINNIRTNQIKLERNNLNNGFYFFQVRHKSNIVYSQKLIIR